MHQRGTPRDVADAGAGLDGHGKIVLPGFVDVHNHLWQTLIRGCATDKELNGWLSGCVLPLYASAISSADGYAGGQLATLDLISSGVTTVTDWSRPETGRPSRRRSGPGDR